MSPTLGFRQIDEKHVSFDVSLMEWSHKMDLLALASSQGEISLHRLSFQKVWVLPRPSDGSIVTAMTWKPDSRILAVGLSSGSVQLLDVEKHDVLHTNQVGAAVTCLHWAQESTKNRHNEDDSLFTDNSNIFLPKVPVSGKGLNSMAGEVESESKKSFKEVLAASDCLDLLICGDAASQVTFFALGVLSLGSINGALILENNVGRPLTDNEEFVIQAVSVSYKLDTTLISGIIRRKTDDPDLSLAGRLFPTDPDVNRCILSFTMGTAMLSRRKLEIRVLAQKFAQMSGIITNLDVVIKSISETWEDILQEIDSKLVKYAEEKRKRNSPGTISDDFLELLMFGTPSDDLDKFLLHDITDKGLKRLGQAIEQSYSNIQKMVLKHLQVYGHALLYHLSDVRGLSTWAEMFGCLGLMTSLGESAERSAGTFLLKCSEVQQTVDLSMKNFKTFFRWLYVVILRLSDETVPPEISKITEQDLSFVADFLKDNFVTEVNTATKSSFNLERVGQYLKNEPLKTPFDTSKNLWLRFLKDNPEITEDSRIYSPHPDTSLVQEFHALKQTVLDLFSGLQRIMHDESAFCDSRVSASADKFETARIHHVTMRDCFFVFSQFDKSTLDVTRRGTTVADYKLARLDFSLSKPSHTLQDFRPYTDDVVTILLHNNETGEPEMVQLHFAQVECALSAGNLLIPLDGQPFLVGMNSKKLGSMKAHSLAVSGSRKVGCVLFSSRRRVRLFEMDVEEEEDSELDSSIGAGENSANRSTDLSSNT